MCTNMKVIKKVMDIETGEIKYKYIGSVSSYNKASIERWKQDGNDGYDDMLVVPCGVCHECKEKWRRQLIQRTRYELISCKKQALFITLTFNEDGLKKYGMDKNYSLIHKPFQDFMKRLRITLERRKNFKNKLSYLMCGEYGGEKGRPHYHAVIFGLSERILESLGIKIIHTRKFSKKGCQIKGCDFLAAVWQNGFIQIGDVSEKSAGYISKYICKYAGITKKEWSATYGEDYKKPYMVYPHHTLGIDYFLEHADNIVRRGFIYNGNYPVGIPRNYVVYIKRHNDSKDMEILHEIIENRKYEYFKEMINDKRRQGLSFWEDYNLEKERGANRELIRLSKR